MNDDDRRLPRRSLLATGLAIAAGGSAWFRRTATGRRRRLPTPTTATTPPRDTTWWASSEAGAHRRAVTIGGAGYARRDHPVELDLGAITAKIAAPSVRVVEVDRSGTVIDPNISHQFDPLVTPALVFLVKGILGAGSERAFHVYFDLGTTSITAKRVATLVSVASGDDEGQHAFIVSTPSASYAYQQQGASLSSLVDVDGNDWLSYHEVPGPGPKGANGTYRGMPNFHFPDGNFHPGFTVSSSTLLAEGPLRAVVRSTSTAGGRWSYTTTFFPSFARSVVDEAAATYWFLYEGTPGGESARGGVKPFKVLRSDGSEFGHRDNWSTVFKDEAWVAFRSPGLGTAHGRAFFLAHHQPDRHIDSYYLARDDGAGITADDLGSMTVFGFGRNGNMMSMRPDQSPNSFTFGTVDATDNDMLRSTVRSAYRDVAIAQGADETRPGA